MSKLPKKAIDEDIFYMRPLNEVPKDEDDAPWYIPVPIGRHKLQKICVLKLILKDIRQITA